MEQGAPILSPSRGSNTGASVIAPGGAPVTRPLTPPVARMSGARMCLVSLLVVAIAAGQLCDTILDRDHWPFSSYPMFSRPRQMVVQMKRLYGVTANGEVPIVVPRHLAPFHEARLMTAFKRIGRRPDRDARLRAALRWTLDRYEALRASGRHEGPALRGIRLYIVTWPIDPQAANRDAPLRRQLVAEVTR
jgi:hypothetical protein